ncbi:hypothetical protein JW851_02475 [Candidatus Woesearchaeota archaeon]|nr:hypothetical protein [Candidatus Woesearchaeota archaeon]
MKQKLIFDTDELEKDIFMPSDEEADMVHLFELNDRDIYTEDGINAMIDDESIDSSEQGFMLGWISA